MKVCSLTHLGSCRAAPYAKVIWASRSYALTDAPQSGYEAVPGLSWRAVVAKRLNKVGVLARRDELTKWGCMTSHIGILNCARPLSVTHKHIRIQTRSICLGGHEVFQIIGMRLVNRAH